MIQYNDKNYRNIQEQVAKNMGDIDELNTRVHELEEEIETDTYSKTEIDNKDASVLTEAKEYTYSKTQIDNKDADTLTAALGAAKTYTDNMITAVENTHYSITEADYKFLAKANLTDDSISEAHIGNSAIKVNNVDLKTTDGAMPYSELSLSNPSTVQTNARLISYGATGISSSLSAMSNPSAGTIQMGTLNTTGRTILYLFDAANSYYENTFNGGIKIRFPYNQTQTAIDTTFATLKDLPAAVSGTNDGTNWTSLTIGSNTYNIPSGGGSSTPTMYNHIITIAKTTVGGSNFQIHLQFNNFSNPSLNSYSKFMTAYANDQIPRTIIGTGIAKDGNTTYPFDRIQINPTSNRIEFYFIDSAQIFSVVSYYWTENDTDYIISDTVTPIRA